ncbi:MAG: ABC transporter substrate-binding protein [Rhodobiaceae bacterium]|nr:ABC transporter substrate-binding protein [Rhodobiaceae bacterium]MCC0053860.1 ABC transporter substrate-binding protein [Rhodobiaceae bacterium]
MTGCANRFSLGRRRLLVGSLAVGTSALAFPFVSRARAADAVKIGLLHPTSGFYANAGKLCRAGAGLAIADVNAAGGLAGLDGARVEAVNADVESVPESAVAPVGSLDDAGVLGIVGAYASGIALAASEEAGRRAIPFSVDVGVSDRLVRRELSNVFRLGPGYSQAALSLADRVHDLGEDGRRVMIVHVDAPYGRGVALRMSDIFEQVGISVEEVLPTSAGIDDFRAIVHRVEAIDPDVLVPAVYFEDYANLVRAVKGSAKAPRLIASLFGGAASSPVFVKENADIAEGIADSCHWYDPASPLQEARMRAAAALDLPYGHEFFMAYNATRFLIDAIDRAGVRNRAAVVEALAASTFADHGMPYGPTRFENGQNLGAAPAFTQVQASGIRLVAPKGFAEAELKLSALPPPPPPEGEPIAQGASDPAAGTASSEAVGQDQPATQAQ